MPNTADLSRRKLPARMGIGLGAICVVPTLANIGSAEAASRNSHSSKASKPSRANRVRKTISSRKDG